MIGPGDGQKETALFQGGDGMRDQRLDCDQFPNAKVGHFGPGRTLIRPRTAEW